MELVAQNLGEFQQVIEGFVIETIIDTKGLSNEELYQQIISVFESIPGLAGRTVAFIKNVKLIVEKKKEEEVYFSETRNELLKDALKGWLKKNDKDLFYASHFKEFLVK